MNQKFIYCQYRRRASIEREGWLSAALRFAPLFDAFFQQLFATNHISYFFRQKLANTTYGEKEPREQRLNLLVYTT